MGEISKHDNHVGDAPFPLTDVDRWVLSQTDEEFHLHDWDELREIISEFIAFLASLQKAFVSVSPSKSMSDLCHVRLKSQVTMSHGIRGTELEPLHFEVHF
jgi:hypothetical protein